MSSRQKKIRIMHVAECAGGVDRYLKSFLKYIDTDRFENILVASSKYKKEDYQNIVAAFETLRIEHDIGVDDIKSALELRKLIKKYNPDILYAHSSKAGAVARIADIGIRNKCLYNPHGWAFNMRNSNKKKRCFA